MYGRYALIFSSLVVSLGRECLELGSHRETSDEASAVGRVPEDGTLAFKASALELRERCVVDTMGRFHAGEYNIDCNRQDTYVW